MTDEQPDISSIGPYNIVRCLGEGAKGRVYEAKQTTPVRRTVALKVLRASAKDPNDALRFAAEQQALALMDHPGIARVFDAGTDDDGRQWFAMELIDGLPLVEFADRRKLGIKARVELFVRACRAVQHAHQKGIIHRDLKPSNVLVGSEDGVAVPKVIDFGIAKAMDTPLTDETLLTQFGAIIGTPAYMSPEQAEGTVFSIDTRADIYSLGVMLYELVVGCLPVDPRVSGYPGFIAYLKSPDQDAPTPETRFRQLPEDQCRQIAELRRSDTSRTRALLSGDLRWILMTALEKDPARRYQSASALGDDLERFAHGEVVSATPPSFGYLLRKFIARNRLAVAASTIVTFALAGGAIAATVGMIRAEREATVANTVSEFLESVFAEASPFSRSGEDVTARQLLDRAAENIDTQLAGQPLVQGRLVLRIGAAYRGLGLFDEATPLLERALVLLREGAAPALQIADAEYELGYHLVFMSQFARSRELLGNAIEYYRAELGHSDQRLAVALGDLAFNALRSSQNVDDAFDMLEREIGPAVEALGSNHPAVIQLMYMRCWSLRALGRTTDSLYACRESLDMVHNTFQDDVPVLGHNTLALGHTHRALGNNEAAIDLYDEVIGINTRLYGEDHAEIAYAHSSMADAYRRLGNRAAALENAELAVGMMERVHGAQSTEYAVTLAGLARVLQDMHRFEEAEALYHEVITIDTAAFGSDTVRIAMRNAGVAGLRLHQGRFDDAETLASKSLETLRVRGRHGGSGEIGVLMTLGHAAHRLNNLDSAEKRLREAYTTLSASAADRRVQLADATFLLSRLLLDRNDLDEACTLAKAATESMVSIYGLINWRTAAAQTVHGACQIRTGLPGVGHSTLQEALDRLEQAVLPGNIYLVAARELAADLK